MKKRLVTRRLEYPPPQCLFYSVYFRLNTKHKKQVKNLKSHFVTFNHIINKYPHFNFLFLPLQPFRFLAGKHYLFVFSFPYYLSLSQYLISKTPSLVFRTATAFQVLFVNAIISSVITNPGEELYETDETVFIMSELIEGLPDAVALRCLARVPFYLHPKLELVSRSWRAAIRSQELFKARQEVGSSEELLCVCAFDPENLWQLYDPLRDLWITLPVLPSKIRHLAHFGVVSVAGKLYVLGGGSDAVDPLTGDQDGSFATNEVWSYDPVIRQWAPRASMLVPRAMFACCALNGKIVVAGGFTSCRKSISQAEMYDPEKDIWVQIPDLHRTHNSACTGVVIGEKMHVLHKGLSTVQILDHMGLGWMVEDYGWLQGPMAVVHGSIYVMSHGLIVKLDRELRKVVVSASEFRRRIGFAMVGLGDDIYVLGGVIGPDRWNWDIKPMSDVDVLTVGAERPTWRQATPMTRCRGTILGCTHLRI